jgi:type IV secretory pathway TrbD component
MKPNVGNSARIILLIIGLISLVLCFVLQNWWFLFGLIPLIVGATGRCILLKLFKKDAEENKPAS